MSIILLYTQIYPPTWDKWYPDTPAVIRTMLCKIAEKEERIQSFWPATRLNTTPFFQDE
jgi:hypothetical protein